MGYESIWRSKWLTDGAKSPREMAEKLRQAAEELDQMAEAGVVLLDEVADDYGFLTTDDSKVAERFGFQEVEEEEEFEEDLTTAES